jgi:hypothetical protein
MPGTKPEKAQPAQLAAAAKFASTQERREKTYTKTFTRRNVSSRKVI